MARGATGSGIARKEGEKPEGREGKKGSKMIVNIGGGRVGVYF